MLRTYCRHGILYLLRLGLSFPNNSKILRPLVQSPIRLQIDLRGIKMENVTFYEQINLFLENKRSKKPQASVHRPKLVYAGLMHAYVSTNLRTQLGYQKLIKDKFSALMLRFRMNLISSKSHSKPLFSHYIKPYMAPFQNIQKILNENLRFTRNSGSKRDFSQNILKSILL